MQILNAGKAGFATAFSDADPITRGGVAGTQQRIAGARGQPLMLPLKELGHFCRDKAELSTDRGRLDERKQGRNTDPRIVVFSRQNKYKDIGRKNNEFSTHSCTRIAPGGRIGSGFGEWAPPCGLPPASTILWSSSAQAMSAALLARQPRPWCRLRCQSHLRFRSRRTALEPLPQREIWAISSAVLKTGACYPTFACTARCAMQRGTKTTSAGIETTQGHLHRIVAEWRRRASLTSHPFPRCRGLTTRLRRRHVHSARWDQEVLICAESASP